MNPEIEKKQQERTANEQKMAQYQHQNERIDQRIRYLTEGERKKRNHRLITRGAAVESIAPAVKEMSEVAFYSLAEKIFSLPEVKKLVEDFSPGEAD